MDKYSFYATANLAKIQILKIRIHNLLIFWFIFSFVGSGKMDNAFKRFSLYGHTLCFS